MGGVVDLPPVGLSTDDLPMFFEARHHTLARDLREVAHAIAAVEHATGDEHARDVAAARALGAARLFAHAVPATGEIDTRAICLVREMLGFVSPRADSMFAVQGLGTQAIALAGDEDQRAVLPRYASGERIAAFALTEPDAGSDVAAISTRAFRTDGEYVLDGDKLFISNLGVADHAVVVATTDAAKGHAGLTAFWVPLDGPGVTVTPLAATAPHPIGAIALRGARGKRIGAEGQGMKLAMQTLDAFRVSVGAAAVGMARRAMVEALAFVTRRQQFGKPLSEQQLVQAHLADMVVDLDAARLLVLRAAYLKDTTTTRVTTEVSIAKLGATEAASRVIDRAVQLFGGRGVMAGAIVEHLYRAVRPLRIYEGTSEIQRTIIGRALAKGAS